MNIIDALVVTLGLDSKDFEQKVPRSVKQLLELAKSGHKTENSIEKIGKTSKRTASSVSDLSRTVGSFLAVIGGTVAIKNFISDFIDTNAQIERLSKNLGLSVSTISAWSNATEKLGGSAQSLQGTLSMLSKEQTNVMMRRESGLLPYLSMMSISMADANRKARPVVDMLKDMASWGEGKDRTTVHNIFAQMGIDEGTINLILQGRKELELEIQRQKEQTAVTDAQAAQAQKFQIQLVGLKQQWAALGRTLLMDAAPYLEKLLTILENFTDWAQSHEQFIADFLKVIAVGLGAIALATMPINLTVLAVVALALAIALLWDDYQTWKKGGDSLIDWGKWEPGITAATNAIKLLGKTIEYTYGWLDKMAGKFGDVLGTVVAFRQNNIDNQKASNLRAFAQSRSTGRTRNQIVNQHTNRSTTLAAKYMQEYFQKHFGWTAEQAAGIASNLTAESSGNPYKSGDNGKAYGLAQWHPDRQAEFKRIFGHDIRSSKPEEQLAFIQYELTKGSRKAAGNALRGATSAYQAGDIVSRQYESPKDVEGEARRRGDYANMLLGIPDYPNMLLGIPGAANTVQNGPSGSGGQPTSAQLDRLSGVDRSVQTEIGQINIQTQATDAAGIARDIGRSLDFLFTSQANYALVP